jgi:hypothetical protein
LLRTGSAHILRRRIWLLVYGKDAPADPTIREFVDDQNSFMAFRYSAGAGVRTLEQARTLATWLKDNNEGVHEVRVAGKYFDMEAMALAKELPSLKPLGWMLIVLIIVGTVTLESGAFWFTDRGYFRIKQSGHWFSASESDLRGLGPWPWSDPPRLSTSDCQAQTVFVLPGFDAEDRSIMCEFLVSPKVKPTVQSTIRQQVGILIYLGVLFACGLANIAWKVRRAYVVRGMAKRLEERKKKPELGLADVDGAPGSDAPGDPVPATDSR